MYKRQDRRTSDAWFFEGSDGKDYGVSGTWGSDGTAYFWDVTDPTDIKKIDSIQVDARIVNDVKVSEDGKLCVISREASSKRKNGIILIDVTDPSNAEIISEYTTNLTGGVHNIFIYENHVYALNAFANPAKYYVINIDDPKNPKEVGYFEVDEPGSAIHDVWIQDGIAYSSNWKQGVYLVDIGNGIAGGSPSNPVQIGNYRYDSGGNHAAFPFKSKSTGKFYVIMGDEIFPEGVDGNTYNETSGYLHFIDFTDLKNPVEVARYEVPGHGSHNYWVEDDVLYIGMYTAGVRVVDISGDLMGDLYKQGREIAKYSTGHPDGYVSNSTMLWGTQYFKGNIFYSDGLLVFNGIVSFHEYSLTYKSTKTIYETEIFVNAKAGEFNYSQNPSAVEVQISGSYDFETTSIFNDEPGGTKKITIIEDIKRIPAISGSYLSSISGSWDDYEASASIDPTGSYLAPYITTIGLYDKQGEMVAVAKLPKPIKNLPDYDVNFIIRLDT